MEQGKIVKKIHITNKKYKTYVKVYGKLISEDDIPIIFIHGGPGATHNYLSSISNLKINEPIVFYDQINSGRSSSEYEDNMLQISNFIEQLHSIIIYFKIKKCHLVGHSWGSIIAHEYYLKKYISVESIIFYSPSLDIKLWQNQANIYMKDIKKSCNNCNYNKLYEKKHIVDIVKLDRYIKNYNNNLYKHIWGKSEYNVSGLLKNYKYFPIKSKQHILFLTGEYDTASPNSVKQLSSQVRGSTFKIIKNSRHVSHLEKPNKFNSILVRFYLKYYKSKFYKQHQYYNNKVLSDNEKNSVVLSNKLIYIFITYQKNRNKLKKLLVKIENFLSTIQDVDFQAVDFQAVDFQAVDFQAVLDFWYYTKLLGYQDKYKPANALLDSILTLLKKKPNDPRDAVMFYIYIRILIECDNKYRYLAKKFSKLIEISKQDQIFYGYYLTHIVLYDLRFSHLSFNKLSNKKDTNFAIKELIKLCFDKDNLLITDPDLLGEVLLCFKLCNVKNDNFYLHMYNILSKVKPSNDYHLNIVLAGTSYVLKN